MMSPGIRSAPRRHGHTPGPPRDRTKARLLRLYTALQRKFGPQRWWPGRSPYEIAVGAVLTQHTAWINAARAIAALRARRLLAPRRLAAVDLGSLARLIRPAGTPKVKARRVRALTGWILERVNGSFGRMRAMPLAPLRAELLALPGVGPETADAILLYSAGRPVFVADAYARRVLARHRLIGTRTGYEDTRRWLEAHLPSDPDLFNEFHALLVAVGKSHCRSRPRCEGCALRFDLRGRRPAP
jgi:endonuclease III related protein